jgi:hypothetical protein
MRDPKVEGKSRSEDQDRDMERPTIMRVYNNWISYLGSIIAALTGLLILILLGINIFANIENPYIGIYVYMVLPPIFVIGLLLIPIGMYRSWRRWQKEGEIPYTKWPYIDLNKRSHRYATFSFVLITAVFIVVGAVISYKAYHYTESVEFCGKLCHSVMKPEYVAYQGSPHARVPCTACHVGAGAGWYTKSKLSGAYQVYAVTANVYPRPIPTPISNLRPAQETCEQCHWPKQFFGAQQRQMNHYLYDEANTLWPINMLIKTGGGDPKTGQTSGIHWHMNIGVKVEYIARDEKRQDIPWVKITDKVTDRVTVYQDATDPLTEEEIAAAKPRVMDCMDCHNRPSHIFYSPDDAIDKAILTGLIDASIPSIKRIAVEALSKDYASQPEAIKGIANYVTDYYRINHPKFYEANRVTVDDAIIGAQDAFSKNIFPTMKVNWSHYPNNIGHFYSTGCMRCHLGNHKSEDGITITHDCRACHIIMAQGSGDRAEVSVTQEGLEFEHPVDIDQAWKEVGCYECHTGVQP